MARIVSSADEPLGTICFVLCSTGMRIGEVLALRLEDLDFKRQLIHVRSSVYAGTVGNAEERGEFGTPANAARAGDPAQDLFGVEVLSSERSRPPVCKSAEPPVLGE